MVLELQKKAISLGILRNSIPIKYTIIYSPLDLSPQSGQFQNSSHLLMQCEEIHVDIIISIRTTTKKEQSKIKRPLF